jgi:hypothetical protein
MNQIQYTVDLGDIGEVDLLVDYDYTPGRAGTMYDRFGDPGSPPEGCEVQATKVTILGRSNDMNKVLLQHLVDSENFRYSVIEHEEDKLLPPED